MEARFNALKNAIPEQLEQAEKTIKEMGGGDLRQQSLFGTAIVRAAEQHLQCPFSKFDQMKMFGLGMMDQYEASREQLAHDQTLCEEAVNLASKLVVNALKSAAAAATAMEANPMSKLAAAITAGASISLGAGTGKGGAGGGSNGSGTGTGGAGGNKRALQPAGD